MKRTMRSRLGLTALFSLIVFGILVITALIMGFVIAVAIQSGLADVIAHRGPFIPILMLFLASIFVGTIVSIIVSRFPLRPIRKMISLTNQLASGDFSVRLTQRRKAPPEILELAESFNRMAEELQNTELLRSDFVNNFSHEFKTPIVSIKGFAEMVRYDELPVQERNEYLDIIINESSRLSSLATNVLNLSKVEKQAILTEKVPINVSEQIRKCVILLQPEWEKKSLLVSMDGPDIVFKGNEELLGQVWVNLLDNAIKYSPDNGKIEVLMNLDKEKKHFIFSIRNEGTPIPQDVLPRIFDKFYQGDRSHAAKGTGLGLTLVKRIIELHNGTISVCSNEEQGTIFQVSLPI